MEFSQNCEFKKVKQERIIKARNTIFNIRRILCTNGCVSPKLSLSLFDSKRLPILTYGYVIWNVSTQNNVIINGVPETNRTAKTEIKMLYEGIFDEKLPDDVSVQRIGEKSIDQTNRPILIKFRYTRDKDSFLYNLHLHKDKFPFHTNETDKYIKEDEIERLHYKYCKFSLNLQKKSPSLATLSELGHYPITINIWVQMIKYFIRLLKGTENPILDVALQCAKTIETQCYQSVESLLKVNGFAYVVQGDRTLDNKNFPLIFK